MNQNKTSLICILLIFTLVFWVGISVGIADESDQPIVDSDEATLNSIYNNMTVEELEQASIVLQDILNEKRVGSAKLTFEENKISIPLKKTQTLKLQCDYREITSKTKIVYESTNEEVATVKAGKLTAIGAGTAQIKATATFEDGGTLSAECTVFVYVPVQSVKINEKSSLLMIGSEEAFQQTQLHCVVAPENAYFQSVIWTSSDENIATVDENGNVTAVSLGNAVITAKSTDLSFSKTASCKITVTQAAQRITLSQDETTLYPKDSITLKATVFPENAGNKKVDWKSSDETIVTVSPKGKLTAISPGKAQIICTAQDGSNTTQTCNVTVIQIVEDVSISAPQTYIRMIGEQILDDVQLTYTISPKHANYTTVTWSSSNEEIVTVDDQGNLTAHAGGEAVITAKTSDPKSKAMAECTITVEAVPEIGFTKDIIAEYLPRHWIKSERSDSNYHFYIDVPWNPYVGRWYLSNIYIGSSYAKLNVGFKTPRTEDIPSFAARHYFEQAAEFVKAVLSAAGVKEMPDDEAIADLVYEPSFSIGGFSFSVDISLDYPTHRSEGIKLFTLTAKRE